MAQQGMFGVLKWKAAPYDAAGSWAVVGNVRDVTIDLSTGEADVTTRANSGWRATLATLKEGTVDFEMVWEPGDAAFEAIKDAYLAGGTIALAVLDVTGGSGEGLVGDFAITNFSRAEPLEDAMIVSVTAKLADFGGWVTNGAPDPT